MTHSKQIEKALFEAARNVVDPEARRALLEHVCNGDDTLRARLERLLAAQEPAEAFFDVRSSAALASERVKTGFTTLPLNRTATDAAGDPLQKGDSTVWEGPNATIGRYRLLQRLGEGGCGVVYLAEQKEPVRRRVALKIIRLGMDTENVIARFEMERQALALMDHPNIAHVLDAGATETGRPYFVMELVRGVKITDYCDKNHLDTRQRLELFIQVCHAIQHAHQKGVIHRDIKPSNILVTLHDRAPVPKVIDFGIAKATEGRLTYNTVFTAFGQFVGTPAYMSPEQASASGMDVDTRSDIYSLGVLLYELLTGRTPFENKQLVQSGLEEMQRTLRDKEPPRPSTMVTTLQTDVLTMTALQRHTEPPKLVSALKGDLDWIVMKALEKDRQRRYETANGLAMDVERYLNDEPIAARPPSQFYRLQKLVRRNTITFAAGAAVGVALILGFGTSTWLFFKERESRRAAELGRANEVILRRQAEARAKITQAAVLVGEGRYPDADRIVEKITFPESSLEGEAVFRPLGEWAALQGHWEKAAGLLSSLVQVDQVEMGTIATLDYTRCAVALVENEDKEGYELFRRAAVKHFADRTDPLVAERTVKNCLVLPADGQMLTSLAPLSDIAARSIEKPDSASGNEAWMLPWRCVSLALMDYRRKNYDSAIRWSRQCLSYGSDNPARTATIRAILAMALYSHGQADDARSELAQSQQAIEDKLKDSPDIGNGDKGFWFDWALARILLHEASTLLGESSPVLPAASNSRPE
jgi:eukaryotic-like serine/threonine-protein kinase